MVTVQEHTQPVPEPWGGRRGECEDQSGPGQLLHLATVACRRWQRELRLQDWDVTIEIARQRDVGEATMGDCTRAKTKRVARIRLLDPRDIDGQDMMTLEEAHNWELTLVHELLHLQLHDAFPSGYSAGSAEELAIERAIDATSKALVRLSRGGGTTT